MIREFPGLLQSPGCEMVWLEALPPFIVIIGALSAAGMIMKAADKYQNNGKTRRIRLDHWDRAMMERDKSITGDYSKQKAL
eukprot:m.144756 g.144756  ORF g.144756 m.144756 type:complete len:81 (+) comp38407_c1_seq1:103-345(+)